MSNLNKVSFDFDSTLSRDDVQRYAKVLIDRGVEVWVCTSRCTTENAPNKQWNDDLFKVSDGLGIPRERIIFTGYANKSEFLKDKGFKWHIDDDNIELSFIRSDTDIIPIFLFGNENWKEECEEAFK